MKTRRELRKMADDQGYIYRPGRKAPTLRIFEDGTIIRADVDLGLTRNMTVTEAFNAIK